MSTHESDDNDETWLTIAEIAGQLRVNPATVRLWVSKGQLPARRAGMRKLLVSRADLDQMLEQQQSRTASVTHAGPPHQDRAHIRASEGLSRETTNDSDDRETVIAAIRAMQAADRQVSAARQASQNAPPNPDFPDRVRAFASAFEAQADALTQATKLRRLRWDAQPAPETPLSLSHELRAGGNRPGPPELWQSFDQAVEGYSTAYQGASLRAVAVQAKLLSTVLHEIADELLEGGEELSA